tara:strand:- start:40881 stop:41822 length:942 start_codon:yes stop_codon:yes gene_type:complete
MTKILIIKPSSLGDILHGLQVAQSLREQWEGPLHISWVVSEAFSSLVEACETVDQVFIFERKGGIRGFKRLASQIRAQHFDWVLDFQGLARSGLLTFLSHADHKIGRSDAREFSGFAYSQKAPLPKQASQAHAIEILLEFLPLMGLKPELRGPLCFEAPPMSCEFPQGLDDFVLLFPNSRRPEKEWPYFVELTEALLKHFPDKAVVWSGQEPLEPAAHWDRSRFIDLMGKTKLLDVLPLLQRARIVVTNDSGPMHIAAAMGVEVLALFGPTPPECFGPYPLTCPRHHLLRAPKGRLQDLAASSVLETLDSILS